MLLSTSFVLADKARIGGYTVEYDQAVEGDSDYDGVDDRTSYYLDDVLVFSAYDTDGDGEKDMWFTYTNGTYKEAAMRDADGNGRPDDILTYDEEGVVVSEKHKSSIPGGWGTIVGALVLAGLIVALVIAVRGWPKKERSKAKMKARPAKKR